MGCWVRCPHCRRTTKVGPPYYLAGELVPPEAKKKEFSFPFRVIPFIPHLKKKVFLIHVPTKVKGILRKKVVYEPIMADKLKVRCRNCQKWFLVAAKQLS